MKTNCKLALAVLAGVLISPAKLNQEPHIHRGGRRRAMTRVLALRLSATFTLRINSGLLVTQAQTVS
jgi:hypothetical protein